MELADDGKDLFWKVHTGAWWPQGEMGLARRGRILVAVLAGQQDITMISPVRSNGGLRDHQDWKNIFITKITKKTTSENGPAELQLSFLRFPIL